MKFFENTFFINLGYIFINLKSWGKSRPKIMGNIYALIDKT